FYSDNARDEKSSLKIAQKRLKKMFDLKKLNRFRDYSSQEYYYYQSSKVPKITEHKLLISEFLTRMAQDNFQLESVHLEWTDFQKEYHLRPDAFIKFRYMGDDFYILLEVDSSKKFTNDEKYFKLFSDRKTNKEIQEVLPPNKVLIVSLCDKKIENSKVDPLWIKTDFSNFSNLKFQFIK
ncbi:hypothetical protein, partial [Turicibacter sanguinis]|uniref:hypothetical protein n=1 Tax=Turicibacter sanguinis TaxID=154288 RepID=UPI001E5B6D5D